MKLPPQLEADGDLEGLVIQLPRPTGLSVRTGLALFLGTVLVSLVEGFLITGGGEVFLPTANFLFLLQGVGVLVWSAYRRPPTTYTVTLRSGGLSIDALDWHWSELERVTWDCSPPDTVLLVQTRQGTTHRFRCDRRNVDDPIGVTRKQRGWLEHEVSLRIEAAGVAAGVPRDLRGLRRDVE